MKIRKIVTALIGMTQVIVGILSALLAVLLFFDIPEVQILFIATPELLLFYLLILCLFSIFSILSGLFLIREGRDNPKEEHCIG